MGENRKEKLEDQPRWANIEQRVSERREGINYSPELEVFMFWLLWLHNKIF